MKWLVGLIMLVGAIFFLIWAVESLWGAFLAPSLAPFDGSGAHALWLFFLILALVFAGVAFFCLKLVRWVLRSDKPDAEEKQTRLLLWQRPASKRRMSYRRGEPHGPIVGDELAWWFLLNNKTGVEEKRPQLLPSKLPASKRRMSYRRGEPHGPIMSDGE